MIHRKSQTDNSRALAKNGTVCRGERSTKGGAIDDYLLKRLR
jgi:hypothetical protein